MVLNSKKLNEIFLDSLFKEGEDTNKAKIVEGILSTYSFNPEKLKKYKDEIFELLLELPDEFMETKGKGWSFICACNDKHGNQWAEHKTMEQLFVLGMSIDKVVCLFSKSYWNILPGGVPYYLVKDK